MTIYNFCQKKKFKVSSAVMKDIFVFCMCFSAKPNVSTTIFGSELCHKKIIKN